jgi:hypothetical protein
MTLPRAALAGFAMFVGLASAHPFSDDHGDAAPEATPVQPGAAPLAAAIEIDVDRDWFSFTVVPGAAYRIAVTASNIWDTTLELRAPDGETVLAMTNSARSAAPATSEIVWTNPGAAGSYALGVGGHLEFTTGSYALAVTPLNIADADGDGLPDAWETLHFGGLQEGAAGDRDGDALPNLSEFLAMTDPTNRNSHLAVSRIGASADGIHVQWTAAPYGLYRLASSPGAAGGGWSVVGTNYFASPVPGVAMSVDPAAGGASQRVYRIELAY